MIMSWFRFFRVVNLPTVPGDVLVGVAASAATAAARPDVALGPVLGAVVASLALYLFGMADNDVVGAATDRGRPIPDGEISLVSARVARLCCLLAAFGAAYAARLPEVWWADAFVLATLVFVYNRTKSCVVMGLCRGLNVLLGAAAAGLPAGRLATVLAVGGLVALWSVYVAVITRCSEGEEADPRRKALVGFLIGALVYLQLLALVVCYLLRPLALTRDLLVAGAVLLVVLRVVRRACPKVSAS